eukprot:648088-Amorphochlora_amoeboformis.AAC.1
MAFTQEIPAWINNFGRGSKKEAKEAAEREGRPSHRLQERDVFESRGFKLESLRVPVVSGENMKRALDIDDKEIMRESLFPVKKHSANKRNHWVSVPSYSKRVVKT